MPNVSVRVDGFMVAVLAASAVAVWAYLNRDYLKNKFNPASNQNFIYQSDLVQGTIGAELDDGYTVADHVFAAIDVVNPFNESDEFAKRVLFE